MLEHYSSADMETITIGLDTPIAALTPRQLFAMIDEWLGEKTKPAEQSTVKDEKRLAKGERELAKALGISPTTVYKLKKDGTLDGTYSQLGNTSIYDINEVLEVTKKSKSKWARK